MIKWLLKSTNEFRIETMSDVEDFHQEMQDMAANEGFNLASFSWVKKEKKQGGEIVDEYFVVKVSFTFNDAKDPENQFSRVEYPTYETLHFEQSFEEEL